LAEFRGFSYLGHKQQQKIPLLGPRKIGTRYRGTNMLVNRASTTDAVAMTYLRRRVYCKIKTDLFGFRLVAVDTRDFGAHRTREKHRRFRTDGTAYLTAAAAGNSRRTSFRRAPFSTTGRSAILSVWDRNGHHS